MIFSVKIVALVIGFRDTCGVHEKNAHFSPFFKFWFLFLSLSIVKIWLKNWNFDTICIIWKHIQRYQNRFDTLMCSFVILEIKKKAENGFLRWLDNFIAK